jgi:hypothetical protein
MHDFLEDLFADAVTRERRLVIFTVPNRRWGRFADLDRAVRYAVKQAATQDVYFGVGLVRGAPRGRGTAADVGAIGALWTDLDLAGPAHPGKRLPTSAEEAHGVLASAPLPPSIVVHSGNGLHAYWLLKEPWVFDTPAEWQHAVRTARGWHGLIQLMAAQQGWQIENLGDLARVLRLPGTCNRKDPAAPVPVRVLARVRERRYDPQDFEPYLVDDPVAASAGDDHGGLELDLDAEPPEAKLQRALCDSEQFRRSWERRRDDLADTSQSGYDLSLATMAALRGWTDQEIASLVIAHRRYHDQCPEKAIRGDYMRRTIERAKASAAPTNDVEMVDLSRLLAALTDPRPAEAPVDPGPLPAELLRMPGLVSAVMAYNLTTAVRPQPVLALAGALCLQAVLAARKVCDDRGNRTNLYVVGVAPSGGGKDHARKVNRNVLFQAGLDNLEGNEDLASDAGLVAAVEQQPAVLFQLDEFGRFLRTIGDPKKAPHLFNVLTTLMKLYSSADTVFRGKAYADPKRNKVVDQPCVSVYGTSVPERFYESLTADAVQDGFVARLLVFEGEDHVRRRRVPQAPVPVPILEAARWWGEFRPGGNLDKQHPAPKLVPTTPEAGRLFDDLADAADRELARPNAAARALWARAEEKACRLALMYACAADRQEPVIDEAAARWACNLSSYLTRRMLFLAHQWVADGSFDARQKKVLRVIAEAGGVIGHSELYSRTRSLAPRERQEILDNLAQTGQINVQVESTTTKSRVRYVLSGFRE